MKIRYLLLVLLIPVGVLAYYNPGSPTGFVSDFADILTPDQEQSINTKLEEFEKATSNEIAVVTIESLEGDTIEGFAVDLFQDWGIGKAEKDNGVLLLVSEQDRKMRIEVGYGLEGDLTDAESYWIINDVLTPNFKQGDYFTGIDQGVDRMIEATQTELVQPTEEVPEIAEILFYIVLAIVVILVKIWLRSKGVHTGFWGFGGGTGRSSSSGFSGFSGGSSGGGGSSGSW